jgi:ribosome-binding factor A
MKKGIKGTRVNGEVQKALAEIIREDIKDPRVQMMTSVTGVEVAPDLKTCKVWISVLGNEKEQQDTIKGLRSAVGFVRSQLAKKVNLRNTPELQFVLDNSIAYGVSMSKLIDEVNSSDDDGSDEAKND